MSSRQHRLSAALCTAALVLAACGSSGDDASDAAPTTTREHGKGGSKGTKRDGAANGGAANGKDRSDCDAESGDPPTGDDFGLTDVTEQRGLVEPLLGMYGHAVAVGDVDGDGWLDLYVGTFTDKDPDRYAQRGATGPAPDRLLLGGPDGFSTDPHFDPGPGRPSGAAFADLDDDGDPDLVIARNVSDRDPDGGDSVVLENDGGRFREATTIAEGAGARSVAVLDHDGDGRLDLVLAVDRWSEGSTMLLRNDGGLTFSDATSAAGLPDDLLGLGVVAADLDGDGVVDLFLTGANRLFLGDGEGTFDEASTGSTFEWTTYGDEDDVGGVAVGDVDGDGRADLLLGQHYGSALQGCAVPPRLYLNHSQPGEVSFEDVTVEAGLPGLLTKAPHVEVVDLDLDGRLDIVTSASAAGGTEPALLRNLGTEAGVPRFEVAPGLGDERYWVAGVTTDLDHDGTVEIFAVDPDPARPSMLWEVGRAPGSWLEVELPYDARGVGAVIEVYDAGGLGAADRLLRRQGVVVGQGYAAAGPPHVHIGLGDADAVDVRVRPGDGSPADDVRSVDGRTRLRWPEDFRG